jgi:hypothetical protein
MISALENGPWLWQSNTFYTGYSSFFEFCDYVEVCTFHWHFDRLRSQTDLFQNVKAGAKKTPGPEGVGLEKALAGYAKWFKEIWFPGCKSGSALIKKVHLSNLDFQHAPTTATGLTSIPPLVTTHITRQIPCLPIDRLTTTSTDSGNGFFATSLSSTGKSMHRLKPRSEISY